MVISKRIAVDLANRFPASFIVMSHSMNVQTFNVVIALYNEGEALSIDNGATVKATLVSGGYLVCTNRACTYDDNEITVDITNEVGHTSNIPAGELQIEICVKSGDTELYIPYISAYISKSIQDDAAVTPTSYGTVAAAVAEVAAARGTFVTLAAALANKINADAGAVLNSYIADGAVTSAKIATSAIITSLIADNAVTFDKLATDLQDRITSIETTNTSQSNRITALENTVGTINNDMQSVLTGGV